MAIKFAPKTAEEIKKIDEESQSNFVPWPKGNYDYEVSESSEEESKSGNAMIKLRLNVFNDQGHRRVLFDYLVPGSDFGDTKIAHACEAMGLTAQYEAGRLEAEDFSGKTGKVALRIQGAKDGYEAKNVVSGYIKSAAEFARSAPKPNQKGKTMAEEIDDTIPF